MGLFSDTLHDARRPLAGGWLRRSPDEAAMSAPDQDIAQDDMPDSGMQTVFRFQKAESPVSKPGGFREASSRSGAGITRIPAGDPLSVAAEAGSPKPFTKHVEETQLTVQSDNRESELATGQVIHTSPGKIAAANAKSVSSMHQSEVPSGRIEAESYREKHQSEIPEGSERSVSRQGETFLSRPAGRGASPSETTFTVGSPARAETHTPSFPAGRTSAQAAGATEPALSPPLTMTETKQPPRPAHPLAEPHPADLALAELGRSRLPAPDRRLTGAPGGQSGFAPPLTQGRGHAPESAQPDLVIGRIDVVVVAETPAQVQAAPAARGERGYLSRNYLKRL